jgi:gamma-glutamyltranspeptidase/glutathione hydrolase
MPEGRYPTDFFHVRKRSVSSKVLTRVAVLMTALLSGTACSTMSSLKDTFFGGPQAAGEEKRLEGFIGAVVADEPRAALVGRDILATGGSAADAAVAVAFALSVTLPSRAGLGGGGACLAFNPSRDGPGSGRPEAIVFVPVASPAAGGDRPAALPMMARGMFMLHNRYGRQPFEGLLSVPEQLARFGVTVSRALVRDIAVVAGPLSQDPNARAVFAPGGVPLTEGGLLRQPDLGASISMLRTAGVGDLYQGILARRLEAASVLAGGPINLADLKAALPKVMAPVVVQAGVDQVAFLPPPADGGLAAAAAFQVLQNAPADYAAAQSRAIGTALRWRSGGGDPQAVLASGASGGAMPALPASTGFTVLDKDGGAVTCALTMDNLFGAGRIAPGTGILLAASPGAAGLPLLSAGIAWNGRTRGFRAMVSGSGQEGAAVAVAAGINNALLSKTAMPQPAPEPGRANAIACARYLPGKEDSCAWASDPRETGLAATGN